MSGTTAQLTTLLDRLTSYLDGSEALASPAPTPADAMATYAAVTQIVEAQLASGSADLALTRSALLGTHRMLRAALQGSESAGARPERPHLRLVRSSC